MYFCVGWDSRVSISTRYRLDSLEIESQWGARIPAPVQTNPETHKDSCKMGTRVLCQGKSNQGVALTICPHLVPRLKKE